MDSTGNNPQDVPNTTITFAETEHHELPKEVHHHNERLSQKIFKRTSTGQSSTDWDAKSVRSAIMKRMHFVKRKKNRDSEPRVEGPPYHTMDLETVAKLLKSDIEDGIQESQVEERRQQCGYNEMEGEGGVSPVKLLLKQFFNVMILILAIAMAVSFAFGDYIEGGVIAAIAIINAIVGFLQEYKAEKTMDSLRQMASPTSHVIRDGQGKTIPTRELIPGDIIVLNSGDVVGADARIVEAFNMDIDEALLTGESVPVNKVNDVIQGAEIPLGDRINMTYSSTIMTKGRGKAIVTSIGMQTEIGKIAKRLLDSNDSSKTPLQKSLDRMALVLLAVAICAVIITFGSAKFIITDEVILYAISTAIAVIPEGLVAVVTLTQAFGVHSMAINKALIRRMAALEMLGAVTNICSDKTGTLTQSKMVLTRLWMPKSGFYSVAGLGFDIKGEVKSETDGNAIQPDDMPFNLRQLAYNAALCNMSEVRKDKEKEGYHGIGDPTEVALQVFAHKVEMGKPSLINAKDGPQWSLISEYPFDSSIKRMSVLCKSPKGDHLGFLKGATERVLERCVGIRSGDTVEYLGQEQLNDMILPKVDELARGGLRVLSLASRTIKTNGDITADTFTREDIEQDMIFLGLVGIYDPPRVESKDAVDECHQAGITVHMLTGDHIATATAIAREVSILPSDYGLNLPPGHSDPRSLVMSAPDFDRMTDAQVDSLDNLPLVVARCSPDTKVKMIEALHRRGNIAAMTGDGVNDSPSLKEADIGIAMGQAGSDVAKQAADIVLVDDNFATIVKAVEEGRRVFSNISRFVVHMVSGNVAEITPLILGLAFRDASGDPVFPMTPIQILFNNILTSSPPAMSLGLEPVHADQMLQPPRTKDQALFAKNNIIDIFFYGVMIGGICLLNFVVVVWGWGTGNLGEGCNHRYNDSCEEVFRARGALFATLTVIILLHGFTCRDLYNPTWTWSAMKNMHNKYLLWSTACGISLMFICLYVPVLNTDVFKHHPISWEWGMVAASVLVYIAFAEGWKWLKRHVW